MMKVLTSVEVTKVSGGFIDPVTMLFCLTAANIGLGFYNFAQIDKMQAANRLNDSLLDFVSIATIYQEVQLSQLPLYEETRALSLEEAGSRMIHH
ncbi:hypothetical protein [Candidatus Berkiella aquae]|uniref:Uncharacterized protein n=1 Tax=Candidatus Berkiella aquae TaxID=295108 RepID=A0A0Q9YM00_9GAMM|nr:hypothetical protein [Candidatus Berkiella aquae]MCS5710542.1 hypothetical protein [Candidatus Berkiella aquae]